MAKKETLSLRLQPNTILRMHENMIRNRVRYKTTFIEDAIHYYCDSLESRTQSKLLTHEMVAELENIKKTMSRHLYYTSLAQSMMAHILAAGFEYSTEYINRLRGHCVGELRKGTGIVDPRKIFKEHEKDYDTEDCEEEY